MILYLIIIALHMDQFWHFILFPKFDYANNFQIILGSENKEFVEFFIHIVRKSQLILVNYNRSYNLHGK